MLGVLIGLFGDFFLKVVNAGTGIALFAFGYEVGEFIGVAGGLPDHRVHKDTAIKTDYVVAHLDDAFPPSLFYVVL
jgi:hypothetical protein